MRKLVESTFVTLDGVVQRPQDWNGPYLDGEHMAYATKLLFDADALLLGRETYEIFAGAWSQRPSEPYTDRINALPKHVASRTLRDPQWNATVLGEDVPAEVAKLKQQPGDGTILKFGTGTLDKALMEHGLIDEFHFWVFPVLAGGNGNGGQRMIDGLPTTYLQLRESVPLSSGIVVHVCTPK